MTRARRATPGLQAWSGIEIVTELSPSDSINKSVSVKCPTGKKVLGGGGIAPGYTGMILQQSTPLQDGSGWNIYVQESQPTTTMWAARVYAVCATVAS